MSNKFSDNLCYELPNLYNRKFLNWLQTIFKINKNKNIFRIWKYCSPLSNKHYWTTVGKIDYMYSTSVLFYTYINIVTFRYIDLEIVSLELFSTLLFLIGKHKTWLKTFLSLFNLRVDIYVNFETKCYFIEILNSKKKTENVI